MAVTGKFQADFASFFDAVQKAEVSLKSFESGAGKVETSLNRVSNSLSGTKLISDATLMVEAVARIGGASKLTEAEQARVNATLEQAIQKYRALGQQAPSAMDSLAAATAKVAPPTSLAERATGLLSGTVAKLTAAFSISSIIDRAIGTLTSWTTEVISSAGALTDLSAKTGLSIDTLQRFAAVGAETGVSVDAFAQAAFALGTRLNGGSGSVRAAVEAVGLSYTALRAQKLDQQFAAISAALEQMADPQERNRLALELFGKSGAIVLPAIAGGYTKLAAAARTASDDQVKAIDAATDRWSKFVADQKTGLTSWLGNLVLANDQLGQLTKDQQQQYAALQKGGGDAQAFLLKLAQERIATEEKVKTATQGTVAVFVPYSEQLRKAQAEVEKLTASQLEDIDAAVKLGKTTDEIANKFGLTDNALRLVNERYQLNKKALSEADAAAKKYNDAVDELLSSGETWRVTLKNLDTQTVESVKNYLAAGVAQGTLATAYDLTATQVKAVSLALAEEKHMAEEAARAHEKWAQSQVKAGQEASALWDEYHTLRVQQSGTARDVQIAQIEQWKSALIRRLKEAGEYNEDTYSAIEAVAKAKLEAIAVDWSALSGKSRASLQETADKARATFQHVIDHADQFAPEVIEQFWKTAEEAQKAADSWGQSFGGSLDDITAKVKEATLSWSEAMDRVRQGQGMMIGTVQNTDFTEAHRREIQNLWNLGRYQGPVVGGTRENPRGTGPDWRALGFLAMGGPAQAGRPYMVGERGPELFVPQTSGRVFPHGSAAIRLGDVYITQPLGTAYEIARVVGEAQMQALRESGVRFAEQ